MEHSDRIFVAGHKGLVGSAVVAKLRQEGYSHLILRCRQELDLLNQQQTQDFFKEAKIDYVVLAAAKVGGIYANSTYPADFLYENLTIATNVIRAAAENHVKKFLYLGSSCIYPKSAPQPIREESLLTAPLEGTNEGYALAKIAGLKLCQMYFKQYRKIFISAMPTNLYGPGDNFHPENSHVIPGMMRRFHEAKVKGLPTVKIWGTGSPLREFLHVSDLANGIFLLLKEYHESETINIGTGEDISIASLARLMKDIVQFQGEIEFDPTKPDGTPRKVLDISRIKKLGWKPIISLENGLRSTYEWACKNGVF